MTAVTWAMWKLWLTGVQVLSTGPVLAGRCWLRFRDNAELAAAVATRVGWGHPNHTMCTALVLQTTLDTYFWLALLSRVVNVVNGCLCLQPEQASPEAGQHLHVSHTPTWNAAIGVLQFTCIGELLAAAVFRNKINTRLFWALGRAGSSWHVLRLLSWGSPVQGGADALRAARASGSFGCFHQQHAGGDRHCWAALSWSPSPSLLCSSGWVLQDGAM